MRHVYLYRDMTIAEPDSTAQEENNLTSSLTLGASRGRDLAGGGQIWRKGESMRVKGPETI